MLEADGLVAGFGSHTVLHGIDLTVRDGELSGIFGLNGAGKSVTLKVLAGLYAPWEGTIRFRGEDITKTSPEDRVELGMGHVPQGRNVFPELTVEENLRLGAYVLRRKRKDRYAASLAAVYDRFPLLADRRQQVAGTMSGGQQAALAVGRALVNEPSLILVDEPSAGLAPVVVADLLETLKGVADTGVTMVMVEQNVAFGLRVVDTAHILQTGRIVYEGEVASLDRERLAGYLGIGRMLSAGVLGPAKKPAAGKKPAAKKKPAQRKTKPAAKKKPATTKKKAVAKKKASPVKKSTRKKKT